MSAAKVLVVEDELALAEVLADNLRADGRLAESVWRGSSPNLVVLDVMLPGADGYSLCRAMRATGDDTPVLFLSAKGEPQERVMGLEAGGDDYLAKPFYLPEFLVRVRGLLHRSARYHPMGSLLSFGGHQVDLRGWTVRLRDGREEALGERELGILQLLARRRNEVVSRDDILDSVWGNDVFPSSRTVDNFVMKLRRLFEPDPANPVYFHTVWGVGYRFTPGAEAGDNTSGAAGRHGDERA